jgi:hypothetical protein
MWLLAGIVPIESPFGLTVMVRGKTVGLRSIRGSGREVDAGNGAERRSSALRYTQFWSPTNRPGKCHHLTPESQRPATTRCSANRPITCALDKNVSVAWNLMPSITGALFLYRLLLMSVEAPPDPHLTASDASTVAGPPRRSIWRRILGNRFLFISIVVHLLFGLGAAVLVVQRYTATRKLTFKGGPPSPNPATRAIEHKVQMAKKQSTTSAPATAKRITTTGLSKVTLPEMPAMPKVSSAPTKMAGVGGAGVASSMGAAGPAGGAPGGAGATMFGLREVHGGGLQGTFYDLKQTNGKRPSGMNPGKYGETVVKFVKGGWNESELSVFYKAPTSLYSTQILIPDLAATEGPKAFQVENVVQPKMWVALYKGEVIAPESGTFYFVGAGDDVLLVRFNKVTVLNACWNINDPSLAKTTGHYTYGWTGQPGGFTKGDAIQVEKGRSYPIEILVGEQPGGSMHAVLLIENAGGSYTKDSHGNPILPVFRMGDKPPALEPGGSLPPHLETGLVWKGSSVKKSISGLDALHKP